MSWTVVAANFVQVRSCLFSAANLQNQTDWAVVSAADWTVNFNFGKKKKKKKKKNLSGLSLPVQFQMCQIYIIRLINLTATPFIDFL